VWGTSRQGLEETVRAFSWSPPNKKIRTVYRSCKDRDAVIRGP
jgi:hypothetical protein